MISKVMLLLKFTRELKKYDSDLNNFSATNFGLRNGEVDSTILNSINHNKDLVFQSVDKFKDSVKSINSAVHGDNNNLINNISTNNSNAEGLNVLETIINNTSFSDFTITWSNLIAKQTKTLHAIVNYKNNHSQTLSGVVTDTLQLNEYADNLLQLHFSLVDLNSQLHFIQTILASFAS